MPSFVNTCTCGSGKYRRPIIDAAGIFCTYACEDCREEKKKRYNPAIFNNPHYAATGNEEDIYADYDDDFDKDDHGEL